MTSRYPLLSVTAGALALSFSCPARCQTEAPPRPYCAARPGLGTPPCTIAPGGVSVEMAIGDVEWNTANGVRTRSLLAGDLSLRAGVSDDIELLAAWTPFGTLRTQAPGTPVRRETGMGDVTLGAKVNLARPDGSGLSVAVLPFVGLPFGGKAFGAGDWNVGFLVPGSYALSDTVSLQLTSEFDLAADRDGRGRHPAYNLIGGVGVGVARGLSVTAEIGAGRDLDPEATTVQTFAGLATAWMVSPRLQLDAGGVLGLNAIAPDARVYLGVARLF